MSMCVSHMYSKVSKYGIKKPPIDDFFSLLKQTHIHRRRPTLKSHSIYNTNTNTNTSTGY
jgi:hypothetical protein